MLKVKINVKSTANDCSIEVAEPNTPGLAI